MSDDGFTNHERRIRELEETVRILAAVIVQHVELRDLPLLSDEDRKRLSTLGWGV